MLWGLALLAGDRGLAHEQWGIFAPLVALDLRPNDEDRADNRALITTEPTSYALHFWNGEDLVTHSESCGEWDVLAHFGEHLKPMVREMKAERR